MAKPPYLGVAASRSGLGKPHAIGPKSLTAIMFLGILSPSPDFEKEVVLLNRTPFGILSGGPVD
jgi:hypothetical protein